MKPSVVESSRSRYAVGEFLAEGGMGAIYLGRRVEGDGPFSGGAGEEVILKALLPEYVQEQHFVDLFLREARLTAGLDHPNIVRTLDLVTGEDTYFIVMEYVCGADLRTVQRRAKRRGHALSPQAAIFAGLAILEALGYAHSRLQPDGAPLGLIHRDVSPSNILVGGDGVVKLSDFGIAKLATHRSVFYRVKGKVGYMSPEQARGEPLDARSDLFSLAVCVHEGLTGERLFAATPMATAAELYARPAPRPSDRRPGIPHAIDAVMTKALDYDRTQRFQGAAELRDALLRAAAVSGMLYRREDMASHLAEVLGREPRAWLRGGLDDERAGLTVPYAAAPHLAALQHDPFAEPGDLLDADDLAEDDEPSEPPRRRRTQITGAAVVSVLDGGIGRGRRLVESEETAVLGGLAPAARADVLAEEMTVDLGSELRSRPAGAWSEEVTQMASEGGIARRVARDFDEPTAIAARRLRPEPAAFGEPAASARAASPPSPASAPPLTGEVRLPPPPSFPGAAPPAPADPLSPRARRLVLGASVAALALGVAIGLLAGFLLFAR